jgi:hypothetical protein
VRCKACGCTLLWEPLATPAGTRLGVNMRNFDAALIGRTLMRLLDGAQSWESSIWKPPV